MIVRVWNWRHTKPSVLRREFGTKVGDSLLNLIEHGPLVDRGTGGLPKKILPHLESISS
jgi:hypothetical protein